MNKAQLEALLKKAKQHGTWEEDLVGFGLLVVAETKRLRAVEDRRLGCRMAGGHVFRFEADPPSLEWGTGYLTVEQWKSPPAPCTNCDGELGVTYREGN